MAVLLLMPPAIAEGDCFGTPEPPRGPVTVTAPAPATPQGRLKRGLRRVAHAVVTKLPWRVQDRIYFLERFGRLPNLSTPVGFNEKVLYRKSVHGDYTTYGRLSDKFAVRDFIAARIGSHYLIPLLHETTDPTSLLTMPQWQRAVVKSNHGSGMVELLLDEPDLHRKHAIIENCRQWLQIDFSKAVREIHYRGIPPRILVEQCIGDGTAAPVDYKFHMFRQADGGFQYVLQVIYSRLTPPLSMTFFVNNLKYPFHGIRDDGLAPPCEPELLQQTLDLSKALAAGFDYVRVDWYIHEGRIYFGELTFTPGAGLVTGLDNGLEQIMGQMWVQHRAPQPRLGRAPPRQPGPDLPGLLARLQFPGKTAASFAQQPD